MILGLGKGRVEVFLEKYNYQPGETISGKINLKLKKPIHARGLKVGLIGEQTVTTRSGGGILAGGTSRETRTEKSQIYHFEIPLDDEKDYHEGEYAFQIKIPEDPKNVALGQVNLPEGTVGTVLKTIQAFSGTSQSVSISWHVRAYLDIPRGLDVSKKVSVTIG
jgi:hypothetical protein